MFALGACSDRDEAFGPTPELPATQLNPNDASVALPDSAINRSDLHIRRISPDHGSFLGGNQVILRGAGYTEETFVFFDGRMVQPAEIELISNDRLAVIAPAGEPGLVDVMVQVDDDIFTLDDGYLYESLHVEPSRGSVAGGTLITVFGNGTMFDETTTVTVGGIPCTEVAVASATELTCRTGVAAGEGEADVVVLTTSDSSEHEAEEAFSYYDGTDPFYGGLGGGPIAGQLNVTVLDTFTSSPLPDSFVIVGEDLQTEYQGVTDSRGQISFANSELAGPVTIHVAKDCFEKASFVSFDATDVTIFLQPVELCTPPTPGDGGGGGLRSINPAFVSGVLVWPPAPDRGTSGGPWSNVPKPRPEERRVAYVYATQPSLMEPNPPTGAGGVVTPASARNDGELPYRILVRPGAMAVYALAGLENTGNGKFTPYAMGIARNILAGPSEERVGVRILMNIPLDRVVDVAVGPLPEPSNLGPDRFRAKAHVDLGGEGMIVRNVNGYRLDEIVQPRAERGFRFFAQPSPFGALADARYRFEVGWYTGNEESIPLTVAIRNQVQAPETYFDLGPLLGVPVAVAPANLSDLPSDRVLRWKSSGDVAADLHVVLISGGDGLPAWRLFVPGDQFEAPIPDLSTILSIDDIARGAISWGVYAIKIPSFDYNTFSYQFLNSAYWSHYSVDAFLATH